MINGYQQYPMQPGIRPMQGPMQGPSRVAPYYPAPVQRYPGPAPRFPAPNMGPYPYPYQQHSFVGDLWHGLSGRAQEIGQYILHPLDASKRQMPYHNPYTPYSAGETTGRWIVNGGLIAGAVVLGKGLLGGAGGGVSWGSGASVGSNFSIGAALGGVVRTVGSIITAPFRLIGNLFGAAGAAVGMG